MQFIYTTQVILFERMPDGPVKDIFDEYAHVHEMSEGDTFYVGAVIDWAADNDLDNYTFELDDFLADNNVTRSA